MSTNSPSPKRGEVWLVNLDPAVGDELQKTRPAVVVNSDAIGRLRLRLVAPITEWKLQFSNNIWHVKIVPDSNNGLSKDSAVDTLQLRGLSTDRFVRRLGYIPSMVMEEIAAAIAAVVEYV